MAIFLKCVFMMVVFPLLLNCSKSGQNSKLSMAVEYHEKHQADSVLHQELSDRFFRTPGDFRYLGQDLIREWMVVYWYQGHGNVTSLVAVFEDGRETNFIVSAADILRNSGVVGEPCSTKIEWVNEERLAVSFRLVGKP